MIKFSLQNSSERFPNLKVLKIHDFLEGSLPKFGINNLRELHIGNSLHQLWRNWILSTSLQTLELNGSFSLEHMMLGIESHFRHNRNSDGNIFSELQLSTIKLPNCGSVSSHILNRGLQYISKGIEILDLSFCQGFKTFGQNIEFPKLKRLVLNKTEFSDQGLIELNKALSCQLNYPNTSKYPCFREISLTFCIKITDSSWQEIISSATGNAMIKLRYINLTGTAISKVGADLILKNCPKIQTLVLDSCRNVPLKFRQMHREQHIITFEKR